MGRIVPAKNYFPLPTALGRRDQVAALISGSPARACLEGLAKYFGFDQQVRFFVPRDDVTACCGNIFVLQLANEGMSNTLPETMASGGTSFASDVGENPEIVVHVCAGYLFASGDKTGIDYSFVAAFIAMPTCAEVWGRWNSRKLA